MSAALLEQKAAYKSRAKKRIVTFERLMSDGEWEEFERLEITQQMIVTNGWPKRWFELRKSFWAHRMLFDGKVVQTRKS